MTRSPIELSWTAKNKDESATHLILTIWGVNIEMLVCAFFPNHVPEPAESILHRPRNG